jgi:hypothetical protein
MTSNPFFPYMIGRIGESLPAGTAAARVAE